MTETRRPTLVLLSVALIVGLAGLLLAPAPAAAGCGYVCPDDAPPTVLCAALLTTVAACDDPAVASPQNTTNLGGTQADCTVGAAGDGRAYAGHTTAQGIPASCQFAFQVNCLIGGTVASTTTTCTITDTNSDLPVELMDFSVESEESEKEEG